VWKYFIFQENDIIKNSFSFGKFSADGGEV
jgi:hypothetical protein